MKKTFVPLTLITAAIFGAAPFLILNAPYESTMGLVQKIFYYHLPSAIMFLATGVMCGIASARFLFGGLRRRDPVEALMLDSGDAFVFGGASRLRYHGVARIMPGTAPWELGLEGRINLTFRQY